LIDSNEIEEDKTEIKNKTNKKTKKDNKDKKEILHCLLPSERIFTVENKMVLHLY